MIKVSVIVTVYNGEKYIRECLNSILVQTLQDIEIICVDDASTDGTKNILAEYSQSYEKISVITNTVNSYAGVARNRGLTRASGEYVIFLDADDIYEPDMLEAAYQKANLYQADICIFAEDQFADGQNVFTAFPYPYKLFAELAECGSFSPDRVKEIIFSLWNGWAWDKLFKRSFVLDKSLRFQNLRTSNDAFFVHAAIASAYSIVLLDRVLVHHRVNVKTSLSNTRAKSWKACFLYLKALREYLIKKGFYTNYEKSFVNWAADFLYWNYQTLNETSREQFYLMLREQVLDELELSKYDQSCFDNRFYYCFIQKVMECKDPKQCGLPLYENEKYRLIYQTNRRRIEKLLLELNCSVAIWGAGERGKAFAAAFGTNDRVHKVFDIDTMKQGMKLANGLVVEAYTEETSREIGCILALNAAHISGIMKEVSRDCHKMLVFDIASYINFPLEKEMCMYSNKRTE